MVWVVAEFKDKTVGSPSDKWISVVDGKTFCKWPLKDVEKKAKANTIPDDSKNWELHECRLLMNGEKFDSYESAREAVQIAQEHSTMSSYIKSKPLKRARKRPAKFITSDSEDDNVRKIKSSKRTRKQPAQFATSESESDNELERKEIESMRKSDLKIISNVNKTYAYSRKTSTPLENTLNNSIPNDGNVDVVASTAASRKATHQPCKKVEVRQNSSERSSSESSSGTDESSTSSSDSDSSSDSGSSSDSESPNGFNKKPSKSPTLNRAPTQPFSPALSTTFADNNRSRMEDVLSRESSKSPIVNRSPLLSATVADHNQSRSDVRPISFQLPSENIHTRLFSPAISTINGDEFESLPTNVREELNEIKKGLSDISQTSKKNSKVLEEMKELALASIAIFKTLSAEVFKCKEEIKKRNGLFTDMLHPDVEVPLNDPEHYDDLNSKLRDKRLIDNLAKYLATIHNEHDEEEYVKASMQTLFTFKFFMGKVTWKKEPDRVYVKKSRISKCWRDSFKLKFGAKQPPKSDKEVDKFIHGVCRRYKDTSRKAKRTEYD